MGFSEEFNKEKKVILSQKRPYETAAFVIFAIMFLQQAIALVKRFWDFVQNGWFNNASTTTPGFFARILAFDTTSWLYVLLAFGALAFWYFLIYIFVWRYSKNNGYAKWTWTVLVVFGPNIFFTPPYILYSAYVFRPYIIRFIKAIIVDYQEFDPAALAAEEAEIERQINEELIQDQKQKEKLAAEKAALKAEEEAKKVSEKEEIEQEVTEKE